MQTPAYDIFEKEGIAVLWLEAVPGIEEAKLRIEEFATQAVCEYFVFEQTARQMVYTLDGSTSGT
jgi:hypothetical protein